MVVASVAVSFFMVGLVLALRKMILELALSSFAYRRH